MNKLRLFVLSVAWILPAQAAMTARTEELPADTTIAVDRIQVTAIKQGMALRSQPVASTIVGERTIERGHVDALKALSQTVPNLHLPDYGSRMTSSIYVRGLGTRIDQPVIGLNIDNVPVMQKNDFDVELADAERIEVLRGPQSTLPQSSGKDSICDNSPFAFKESSLLRKWWLLITVYPVFLSTRKTAIASSTPLLHICYAVEQ